MLRYACRTFEFEIFNIGNGNSEEYADVDVSAFVETEGVGDYHTSLEITGPVDQVNAMTSEGFYVRKRTPVLITGHIQIRFTL